MTCLELLFQLCYTGKNREAGDRMNLIDMARESTQITKQGWYEKGGRRIPLTDAPFQDFSDVIVFDSNKLTAIQNDDDEFFERSFYGSDGCQFFLLDADSFEAARELAHPLVMNFANSVTPGGGFLHGARAQEESLCRASTLYASISSEPAMEMYRYNRRNPSPVDSDYMLLSPNVCVFRGADGRLLDEPYSVSVFTIPAPNKHGLARMALQDELDQIMTDRLHKFLLAAARYGYRNLVLGAWGCGAFGHDTATVAGYFYHLFFEENLAEYFDTVVFAILRDECKLDAFAKVFGDEITDCRMASAHVSSPKKYLEAISRFPSCNHTVDIASDNLGWTQGIMADGTPFEAELWANGADISLSIVMPEFEETSGLSSPKLPDCGNVVGFRNSLGCSDGSVLCIGMVARGEDDRLEAVQRYVKKLTDEGIVRFTTAAKNGSVLYVTDENGTDLVRVTIALVINGERQAVTPLNFKKFAGTSKQEGKVIPLFRPAMDYEAKLAAYNALVRDVATCPKLDSCNEGLSSEKMLEKCPDCEEINLWSYWQGGRDHLGAKILLVGQDWGCYRPGFTLGAERKAHPEQKLYYRECDGSKNSETDQTLCELFAELGYDIVTDGDDSRYQGNVRALFFTNFVLCYRCKNISGDFQKRWKDNCGVYFQRLVEIIQPQVILCLGREVYDGVATVACCHGASGNYNSFIEGGPHKMRFGDSSAWVFPLAHPGGLGTFNRGGHDKNEGKRRQVEDWRRVKAFLNKLSI